MADLSNLLGSLRSFAERGDQEAAVLVRTFDNMRALQRKVAIARFTSGGDRSSLSELTSDSIDGTPSEGDIILMKDQVNQVNNGLYKASAGNWSRLKDDAGADVMAPGLIVNVTDGDRSADTQWEQVSDGTKVGTDPIVMKQVGADERISPSNINLSVPTFSARVVVTGNGDWSTPPFLMGTDGTDATYEQQSVPQSFTVDNDPQVFEKTDVASGFFIDLATTGPLPACTANGGGSGKTLTGNVNGTLTVDGVLVDNRIVLVKNQVNQVDNGLYQSAVTGDGSTPWQLVRIGDWDTNVVAHQTADVTNGTVNANTSWWVVGTFSYAGPLSVDGVGIVLGDTVLVSSGGSGSDNAKRRGLYTVSQEGTAGVLGVDGTPYILRRHVAFDTSGEISNGASVTVLEGDTYANTTWLYPPGNYFIGSSGPIVAQWDPNDATTVGLLEIKTKSLIVEEINGQAPGGGGAGAVLLFGGALVFDTDGSGNPQTYSADVILSKAVVSATAAKRAGLIMNDGQARNLRVKSRNIDGGDNTAVTWHATVYKNGTATALTLTGSDSNFHKDSSHLITFLEGDELQIFITVTLTDGPTNPTTDNYISASVEFAVGEG